MPGTAPTAPSPATAAKLSETIRRTGGPEKSGPSFYAVDLNGVSPSCSGVYTFHLEPYLMGEEHEHVELLV